MTQTPRISLPFNEGSQKTDWMAFKHIVSAKAFHITSGENHGKYVFRQNNLYQYTVISGRSALDKSQLSARALLGAITKGTLSLEEMALEGNANPERFSLAFMEEVNNRDGFNIRTGEGMGSYSIKMDSKGELALKDNKLVISGGDTMIFDNEDSRLLANDLLVAIKRDQIAFGVEKSVLFNIARRENEGRKINDRNLRP